MGFLSFRFFLLSILSISAVSLVLFSCGVFIPSVALFSGLLLAVLLLHCVNKFSPLTDEDASHSKRILLLILCCLVFRAEPYLYLLGGQDQGVYVNMAAYYSRSGKHLIEDEIPRRLRDGAAIEVYKSENQRRGVIVEGKMEGIFLPGVYIENLRSSEYVFQFFHLHPLLMAVAGWLLGMHNMVYSLVLLSIASVVAMYLLAYEISGSRVKSMTVGLLLAFNPLHAFFSKFPVTENVALFFSASALYFLARFRNTGSEDPAVQVVNLSFSAASMAGLFFTRISGFMYVPFFLFLGFLALIHPLPQGKRKKIVWYVFVVCALCALSLLQGWYFSFPYTREILRKSFSRLLGSRWEILLPQLFLFGAILFASVKLSFIREKWRMLLGWMNDKAMWFFVLLFAAGGYRIYTLAFTRQYSGHSWIDLRWNMAAQGLDSLRRSSFWVAVQYLSPFLFLLFLLALFRKKNKDVVRGSLLFFLFSFWGYILLLQWTIPYQYYYARYILSEVLPYTILFAVIYAWDESGIAFPRLKFSEITYRRLFLSLLLCFSMVYALSFSVTQLGKKELNGVKESLDGLMSEFGRNDAVLMVRDGFSLYSEIKTSMMFYYGINVVTVSGPDVPDALLTPVSKSYNNVFLLTQKKETPRAIWDFVGKFSYEDLRFAYTRTEIPRETNRRETTFYLYRLDLLKFLKAARDRGGAIETLQHPDRSGFYSGEIWTTGAATFFNLDFPLNGRRVLVLRTRGWRPDKEDIESLEFYVEVNGHAIPLMNFDRDMYRFIIPEELNIETVDSVMIRSSTFVPKDVGAGSDARALGIDLESIYFRVP